MTTAPGDFSAMPGRAAHRPVGTVLACAILLFACLNPLATAYAGLPDISGGEGGLAVLAWVLIVATSGRAYGIDAILFVLGVWMATLAVVGGVSLLAAVVQFALLSAPFTMLRLLMFASESGLSGLRRTLRFLVVAQVGMLLVQQATRTGIDDLAGTFVGTGYGAHIASFLALVAAGRYAVEHPGTWGARGFVAGAMGFAYLADSKIALVFFLTIAVAYLVVGRGRSGLGNTAGRVVLAAGAVAFGWAFYLGALGNIPLQAYVDQTRDTSGGKAAVVELVADPRSSFWDRENYLVGAGPGQTVSRTAGLTVAHTRAGAAADRLGLEQAEHYTFFAAEAAAGGFIAQSSATSPASSLLGILGDLGLIGLVIYGAAWLYVLRWIAVVLGWRSWAAMAWAGFLLPALLGEWLEFPAATMFLVASLVLLRQRSGDGVVDGDESEAGPGLVEDLDLLGHSPRRGGSR